MKRKGSANLQVTGNAPDPNTADIPVNFITGIVNKYIIPANTEQMPMQIIPEARMQYNPELKGVFVFVPGDPSPADNYHRVAAFRDEHRSQKGDRYD